METATRDQALDWLDRKLAEAGIERTGPVESVQQRPWASVFRTLTSRGPVWLKACGPLTAFEAGLYELLQRVCPQHVLTPLAIDAARGRILLPDGGIPVGARLDGAERADAMVSAMRQYGGMQRALAPHDRSMLALGVADMRSQAMPARFDEALEAVAGWVQRHGGREERQCLAELARGREQVAAWCERLAAAPGAATIDHNDLHPWNVMLDGARARFYDWGDSVVAHPFTSMLVPLGMAARAGDDLARLRDAYLEPFADLAPHAELVEALELACRVGKIARALTWQRAIGALRPHEVDPDWARAPFETLASLLDDSYFGGW